MSTKCPFKIYWKAPKKVYPGRPAPRIPEMETKSRNCGKDPKILIRVDYTELFPYRAREGRFHDIFGFCEEHGNFLGKGKEAWKDDSNGNPPARCLRGRIDFVSIVPPEEMEDPKLVAIRENKQRRMNSVKSSVKRMMAQENAKVFSLDDWRIMFEESIEEFIVSGVMEA
jgi:hypothetical protein